jgi:hypothetical protein
LSSQVFGEHFVVEMSIQWNICMNK